MKDFLEFYTFLFFIKIFRLTPYLITLNALKFLFYILGYVIGVRKRVVISQLRLSFPDLSSKEINNLAKNIYSELAVTVAEVFIFDQKYFEGKIQLENFDELTKALSLGKGAIIVSAHFGNWEIGAKLIAAKHGEVYGIVKKQRNKMFNAYLDKQRQDFGIVTIEMKHALKKIIKALNQNKVVAILVDQYATHQGVEMDFLGNKTKVYTSVAQIALKYDAPIIPAFDIRDKEGKHKYIFCPIIEVNDSSALQLTATINSILEDFIRENPQLWFWVHRRWR